MNALLLSAGFGSRLMPLTKNRPKCLMDIGGTSILEFWLQKLFNEMGVSRVYINTHYLSEQVTEKVEELEFASRVEIIYEKDILGTAGTVISLAQKLKTSGSFLVIHCDTFVTENLENLINKHFCRPPDIELTAAVFQVSDTSKFGVFRALADGRVKNFVEKPENGSAGLANAAIYCMSSLILDELISLNAKDLSLDFLPVVVEKTQVFCLQNPAIDIGTVENLKMVRKINGY